MMGDRKKPNLTTEARRHGENQIQIMISGSGLTFLCALCVPLPSPVNGFSVLTIVGKFGIASNPWWIGVSS